MRHFPSDDEIHARLAQRIDVSRRALGGVIGVVDDAGARTIAYGRLSKDDPRTVAADTLFELGCVTKVLTGVLCAEMLERGEIDLADPVGKWLPPDVPSVGRNGVAIAIEHLVTHTSGLAHHAVDVYAPIERVFDLLREHVPAHDVGSFYEYATAGFSLLGYVLEQRAGAPHAALVESRVCAPLAMRDTVVTTPPALAARTATGHDTGLAVVGPFTTPTVTGGYGFHSTASDLLNLVGACAGVIETRLAPAISRMLSVRRRGAPGFEDVGLAWHVSTLNGIDVVSHDGNSMGHRAFVGFVPQQRRGVVALVNGVAPVGVTDICRHLLNPAYPMLPDDSVLLRPAREHAGVDAVRVRDPHRYAGAYQLTPRARLFVTTDGGDLFLSNGPETRRLVPLGDEAFWLPATGFRPDGVVRFELDASGQAVAMTVPDRGFTRKLVKTSDGSAPIWHGRRARGTSPDRVERYVGCYQFDDFVLEVTCVGGTLWAAWTSQATPSLGKIQTTGGTARPYELLHEAGDRFFFKSDRFDTVVTFEPGPDTTIVAVTCRMGDTIERGLRLPAMAV